MADTVPKQASPNVQLSELLGEWVVRIAGKSGDPYSRIFQQKDLAEAFAEGQRVRLGLKAD
ncbi:hypothetical protein [Mesorhizobium jarvisii]|uniref:hypothetical protein n=1 Tax=Mesorhizobium jarvisii TaxID=1777867 RepID=UPI001F0B7195|nr:hypothetical protein [Mesorhizobium jarvisii]MCH4561238.1 hypothetical protein [Mesorhizobium jarvisii]